MSCRHLPFTRFSAAHLPRIAAPSPAPAGSHLGTPVWISPVLKQLVGRRVPSWHCSHSSVRIFGVTAGRGVSRNYPLFMKQFRTWRVQTTAFPPGWTRGYRNSDGRYHGVTRLARGVDIRGWRRDPPALGGPGPRGSRQHDRRRRRPDGVPRRQWRGTIGTFDGSERRGVIHSQTCLRRPRGIPGKLKVNSRCR